jgi:hypothetical protein
MQMHVAKPSKTTKAPVSKLGLKASSLNQAACYRGRLEPQKAQPGALRHWSRTSWALHEPNPKHSRPQITNNSHRVSTLYRTDQLRQQFHSLAMPVRSHSDQRKVEQSPCSLLRGSTRDCSSLQIHWHCIWFRPTQGGNKEFETGVRILKREPDSFASPLECRHPSTFFPSGSISAQRRHFVRPTRRMANPDIDPTCPRFPPHMCFCCYIQCSLGSSLVKHDTFS